MGPSAMVHDIAKATGSSIHASMDSLKGTKGRLMYTISEFAKEVLGSKGRSKERIVEFHRRKEQTSVGHEFIIVTLEDEHKDKIYLRLDRRPANDPHRPSLFLLSSKVPASDSVFPFLFSLCVRDLTINLIGCSCN